MISEDEMQDMPWTHDLMTLEQFEQWYASRKEAGRAIDIETCEVEHWFILDVDPYGIQEARGKEPYTQVGKGLWVRSPESRGWIFADDLPSEKFRALFRRLNRDGEAYKVVKKKFAEAATFWFPDETHFDTDIKSSWDAYNIIGRAVREFAAGRGVLDVRTVVRLALTAMDAGIKFGRTRRELFPTNGGDNA
jgi:hypothetical protein